jgi:transposase-like protein
MARKIERLDARRLYCEELKEIPEIAKQLNIPEQSVYRWRANDKKRGVDWDADRESMRMTSFSAYKQTLKIAIDKLNQIAVSGEIDTKQADAIVKIIKAAKSLHKDVDSLGNILLAMSDFTEFLQDRDSEILEKLQPYLVEFGTVMQKKYGKRS